MDYKGDTPVLYDVDRRQYIENIPHSVEYDIWRSRLTDEQVAAIRGELRSRIDGDEILTSSFIPGSDWTGTVFQPIYEHACRFDTEASALCFGLFLWVEMMEHPDVWGFGRYPVRGVEILGITYFRLRDVPPP